MRALKRTIGAAKRLRKAMTPPDVRLSVRLKGGKPAFRRQHAIGPFVLDFYCPQRKLAVEIDGLTHDHPAQVHHDLERDAWLSDRGVTVMRIAAAEVLADPDPIAEGILSFVAAPPQSLRDSSPASRGAGSVENLLPCEAGEGGHVKRGGGGVRRHG